MFNADHLRVDTHICTGFFQHGLHGCHHIASNAARLCIVHARNRAAAVDAVVKVKMAAHRLKPFQRAVALLSLCAEEHFVVRAFADLERIFDKNFRRILEAGFFLLFRTGNVHSAC